MKPREKLEEEPEPLEAESEPNHPREYCNVGLGLLWHKLKKMDKSPPARITHPEGHIAPRMRLHGGTPIRMGDGSSFARWLLEGRETR